MPTQMNKKFQFESLPLLEFVSFYKIKQNRISKCHKPQIIKFLDY